MFKCHIISRYHQINIYIGWRHAKWFANGMSRMFLYLDRFHVPQSKSKLLNTSLSGYYIYYKELFKPNIHNILPILFRFIYLYREKRSDADKLWCEDLNILEIIKNVKQHKFEKI